MTINIKLLNQHMAQQLYSCMSHLTGSILTNPVLSDPLAVSIVDTLCNVDFCINLVYLH